MLNKEDLTKNQILVGVTIVSIMGDMYANPKNHIWEQEDLDRISRVVYLKLENKIEHGLKDDIDLIMTNLFDKIN